jgi:hypothetical protein
VTDVFGDFDVDDAFDHEPPAPEQVTYRLHGLRREIDALAGAADLPTWDELTEPEQQLALALGETIVGYIVSAEPDEPEALARTLHNARRYIASSRLPAWEALDADDRQIGIDLMALVIGWLRRQGALA